jgi:hypothetical protein
MSASIGRKQRREAEGRSDESSDRSCDARRSGSESQSPDYDVQTDQGAGEI